MTQALAPAYRLRLLVAGTTERSRGAIDTLRRVCATHLGEQADVEIIDIYLQPELARQYRVVAAPTLVRLLPLPVRRVVGDLSDEARVLRALYAPGGDDGE